MRAEVEGDAGWETFVGDRAFTYLAGDATVLDLGEGGVRGTRLRAPGADAAGTPLVGVST